MAITVEQTVVENLHSQKWYKSWKIITLSLIVLILVAVSYYQATHFNANSKINDIEVSGMTADQALKKLQTSVLKNEIYIGEQQIVDGKDTKMGFTTDDLPGVKQHLKEQWSFFPSFKQKDYTLLPDQQGQY